MNRLSAIEKSNDFLNKNSDLTLIAPIIGCGVGCGGLVLVDGHYHMVDGVVLAKSPLRFDRDLSLLDGFGLEVFDSLVGLFYEFLELKSDGKQVRRTVQRNDTLRSFIANLINCSSSGKQLLYKRGHREKDWRNNLEVVDFMVEKGLVHSIIGKDNEFNKCSSWLVPTDDFRSFVDNAKFRLSLKNDDSLVVLRKGKGDNKKDIDLSRTKSVNRMVLNGISNGVQDYNRLWDGMFQQSIYPTLDDAVISPHCKRIFNLKNDFSLGGRWYGTFQNMPKTNRKRIQFGVSDTVEPDFKAMHFLILYALEGIQIDPLLDDPYTLNGSTFDRKTVKAAMLHLINCESESVFCQKVTRSGNPKVKDVFANYQERRFRYEVAYSAGIHWKEPNKPKQIEGFIEGMPDHIDGKKLLDAIKERHPFIAHRFCKPNLGLQLQNIDSNIMANAIQQLVALKIPVLPVHDSLRCRVEDKEQVMTAMRIAYKAITGFDGCITCD